MYTIVDNFAQLVAMPPAPVMSASRVGARKPSTPGDLPAIAISLIVEWWVFRKRFWEAWQTVEAAVAHLVVQGHIERDPLLGGEVLYSNRHSEG